MGAASHSCDVVVIGAGFAGLYAVKKLRECGFSAQGFERGSDVGGVWYWNRYPGARCDCESYYYSYSFSKELQDEWDWSLHYSEQPEILSYLSHVADRFDLRRSIAFDSEVESATFDDKTGRWSIGTNRGHVVDTQFIVSAAGCLSRILRPEIPGLDSFAGSLYYTAAWPPEGVDFSGLRVGIIGTGASGVQAVPRIARQAVQLTVFQRTANWVVPVWNKPMAAEFTAWVKANYPEIRHTCFTSGGGVPFPVSNTLAADVSPEERQQILEKAWEVGGTRFFAQSFADILADQESNDVAARFVADRIREIVRDPVTAELLIPRDHPLGTKRPPMDDDYYATFNRPNVRLVDIRSDPIAEITKSGLRTKTQSFEFDSLVLATGFDAITGALAAIDIRGRDGVKLRDVWSNAARTYLGLSVAGFPNLFTITGPMSPSVLANMPTAIEQHVDWIADCLTYMRKRGLGVIEASADAEDAWVVQTREIAEKTLYPKANSWYLGANVPGKPRQFGVYLGGFGNYRELCDKVAANGYEGFAFDQTRSAA